MTLYYSQVIVLSDEILRRVKDLARKFGNFDVGPNYNQRSGKKIFGGGGGRREGGCIEIPNKTGFLFITIFSLP